MLRKNLEYKLGEFHKKKRGERFMWLSSAIMLIWNAKKLGLDKYMTEKEGKEVLKKELKELMPENEEEEVEIVREVFQNRKKLEIDDYCIESTLFSRTNYGKRKERLENYRFIGCR